jgi:hypothetical protein
MREDEEYPRQEKLKTRSPGPGLPEPRTWSSRERSCDIPTTAYSPMTASTCSRADVARVFAI